jgi:two-component system sensor histidine kinase CpxA
MALAILEQRAQRGEEKYVKSAVAKAAEIANLVNELLSFSKASIGAAAVPLQPVNVSEAISAALHRELGDEAVEQTEIRIPEDLAVASERELFIRAVGNVLRNAARHAAGTPICIHAERSGGDVIISIADSGPGVPEEDLGRIFDAFYRVDSSRTRDTGGTGLGLSIVKTCVETCCGSVSARNRTPHGLEVLIQLPVAEQEVVVA